MKIRTSASTPMKLPWFPWIGKRPFYGWVLAAISAGVEFTTNVAFQTFGTYFAPLQQEFGWSRAILATPRSIQQTETAMLGPIVGFLADRLGPRTLVVIGSLIMGLGLVLFGLTHSVWMFLLSNTIIALGVSFRGGFVLSIGLNNWFRRKRTMANSVMFLGPAMAGVLGVPAVVFIQVLMGWRTSAVLTGLFIWAVGLPLSILLRRSPEPYGLLPDGDIKDSPTLAVGVKVRRVVEDYDFTLREALHTRIFWLLVVGLALGNMEMGALNAHVFLHLEQGVGLARVTAAFVWTVTSMTTIPTRIIAGFFGDRLPKNIILGSTMVILALASFILALATSLPMALAFAVVYGIGFGAWLPVNFAMQGEYFGRRSQGMIRGWLAVFTLPFAMAAPVMIGFLVDIQGTYRLAFILISFTTLAGAALIFMATRPKPPVGKESAPFHV